MNKHLDQKENIRTIRFKLISLAIGLVSLSIFISFSKGYLWYGTWPFSLILIVVGIYAPIRFKFIIDGINKFHHFIGTVLFLFLFFFFITPSSLVLRLIRPATIPLSFSSRQTTYWKKAEKKEFTRDDLTRQF